MKIKRSLSAFSIALTIIYITVFTVAITNPSHASINSGLNIKGNIVRGTCKIVSDDQIIKLENIKPSDFKTLEMYHPVNFNIDFICPGVTGEVAKGTMNGTPDVNDKSAFSNDGTAKNVGLRVFENGELRQPNSSYPFKITNGKGTIQQTAGYVATGGGLVSSGSFISTITYVIDYM